MKKTFVIGHAFSLIAFVIIIGKLLLGNVVPSDNIFIIFVGFSFLMLIFLPVFYEFCFVDRYTKKSGLNWFYLILSVIIITATNFVIHLPKLFLIKILISLIAIIFLFYQRGKSAKGVKKLDMYMTLNAQYVYLFFLCMICYFVFVGLKMLIFDGGDFKESLETMLIMLPKYIAIFIVMFPLGALVSLYFTHKFSKSNIAYPKNILDQEL